MVPQTLVSIMIYSDGHRRNTPHRKIGCLFHNTCYHPWVDAYNNFGLFLNITGSARASNHFRLLVDWHLTLLGDPSRQTPLDTITLRLRLVIDRIFWTPDTRNNTLSLSQPDGIYFYIINHGPSYTFALF